MGTGMTLASLSCAQGLRSVFRTSAVPHFPLKGACSFHALKTICRPWSRDLHMPHLCAAQQAALQLSGQLPVLPALHLAAWSSPAMPYLLPGLHTAA